MAQNDPINPSHYRGIFKIKDNETIAVTRQLDFDLGNYYKYLARLYKKDNPVQDFHKARWYAEDWIKAHEPCISLRYFWNFRFAQWTQRQDNKNLTIRNDCSERAKIAFDFIEPPTKEEDEELYDRYKLMEIAVSLYINPAYWRQQLDEYEAKYFQTKERSNE